MITMTDSCIEFIGPESMQDDVNNYELDVIEGCSQDDQVSFSSLSLQHRIH